MKAFTFSMDVFFLSHAPKSLKTSLEQKLGRRNAVATWEEMLLDITEEVVVKKNVPQGLELLQDKDSVALSQQAIISLKVAASSQCLEANCVIIWLEKKLANVHLAHLFQPFLSLLKL